MKFYTLTLQIQKKTDGRYLKSTTNFRSLFKAFIYKSQEDDNSEFKSLQYNRHADENNAYYIFISTSKEFLTKVELEMRALILKAEDRYNEKTNFLISRGFISRLDG